MTQCSGQWRAHNKRTTEAHGDKESRAPPSESYPIEPRTGSLSEMRKSSHYGLLWSQENANARCGRIRHARRSGRSKGERWVFASAKRARWIPVGFKDAHAREKIESKSARTRETNDRQLHRRTFKQPFWRKLDLHIFPVLAHVAHQTLDTCAGGVKERVG